MSGTDAEKEYYKFFQKKYYKIAETQDSWVQEALRTKQLRLNSGLITYWPECKRNRTGYIEGTSKIYNLPIQSLATAEIIPVAVFGLWQELKRRNMKSFLVNTVHDSAILEVHPDEVLEVQDIAVRAFAGFVYDYLNDIYDIQFNVPLGTGLKVGKHWNEPDGELSSYINTNGTFLHCVVLDKDELKYTPECPYEFKEEA